MEYLQLTRKQIEWFLIIAASSSLAIGCSQLTGEDPNPVGCEINGDSRPNCSAKWVEDEKGNLLIITWADGEKSTIRPTGSSIAAVTLNEKNKGELISNKAFYQFKNLSTGNIMSVSPALAGDYWAPSNINISEIKDKEKKILQEP